MTSKLRHSFCKEILLGQQFIFQQDGVPVHAAQKWLSSGLQLTVHTLLTNAHGRRIASTRIRLTIMFGGRCCRTSVTWIRSWRTSRNWSQRLWLKIWDELSQDTICKSIANFRKRLRACVNSDGGHFEHLL